VGGGPFVGVDDAVVAGHAQRGDGGEIGTGPAHVGRSSGRRLLGSCLLSLRLVGRFLRFLGLALLLGALFGGALLFLARPAGFLFGLGAFLRSLRLRFAPGPLGLFALALVLGLLLAAHGFLALTLGAFRRFSGLAFLALGRFASFTFLPLGLGQALGFLASPPLLLFLDAPGLVGLGLAARLLGSGLLLLVGCQVLCRHLLLQGVDLVGHRLEETVRRGDQRAM